MLYFLRFGAWFGADDAVSGRERAEVNTDVDRCTPEDEVVDGEDDTSGRELDEDDAIVELFDVVVEANRDVSNDAISSKLSNFGFLSICSCASSI